MCIPLIFDCLSFAALVSYGGAPRASSAMGRKDNEAAEKILGNCFTVQILISVCSDHGPADLESRFSDGIRGK